MGKENGVEETEWVRERRSGVRGEGKGVGQENGGR